MNYAQVAGIKKSIFRLVQGTVMLNPDELKKSFALLDGVYSLGGNAFDTAYHYGNGRSDKVLGQWMAGRHNREEIVVIGKGAHPDESGRPRVTPEAITADLKASLDNLQTDYIDLYLLHRDNPNLPVGPIVDCLNEHYRAGRIHAFGGSNWTPERIAEANAYAQANGLQGFVASSPNFSLAEQVQTPWEGCISISGPAGESARQWYQQQNMPLFTWSSLAGGFFSGRFSRTNLDKFDKYFDRVCVDTYCYEDNFKRLDRAAELAMQKGLTIPQVALAYVLSQPLNIFAIVGCASKTEFAANIEALDTKLSPAEMNWLNLSE